jgi:DNA-binding PadR family transcriptional regulator
MGRTTAQPLSAGEAVLGLVIELPGNSYQLERRLEGRFGSAQFGHATAYHALKRLTKQGLIRPIEDPRPTAGFSASAETDLEETSELQGTTYEATPEGVAYFRQWLRASSATPPVREELQAKIAFCGPDDLPRMVEIVREAELACAVQLEDLNERMRRQRRLEGDDPWRRLMGMIVTAGDVAWWDSRIKWLQALRQYLQSEGQRYAAERGRASSPPRA